MNIYADLEQTFLKKNKLYKLIKLMDRLFIIWLYLTIVLMIILKVLNLYSTIIILLIFSGSLFLIILISIKYLFFISKDKLKRFNKDVSLINKIEFCLQRDINKEDIYEFIKILKYYNIKTKKDLELILKCYQNKKTFKVSNDIFFSNLSLLFSIAAFLTAIYNNETDTFSIYLLNIYMLFAFLLVIAFFIINITVTYWKKYHDELYIEIENNLLYIYLNSDKYFNNNYNSKIKYMINRILKN